jgi:hypothetical protein
MLISVAVGSVNLHNESSFKNWPLIDERASSTQNDTDLVTSHVCYFIFTSQVDGEIMCFTA